jgi:hypothetical protein
MLTFIGIGVLCIGAATVIGLVIALAYPVPLDTEE